MIAAFFDIDGTIYRNSLLTEHFKKLIRYELIDPKLYADKVKHTYKKWSERTEEYDKYLLDVVDVYVEALKGVTLEKNEFVSEQVMNLSGNRVYRYTRDKIRWHKSQGHKVIFISGSPDFLVKRMAKKWEADDYFGSLYHIENGEFSGEISPMWGSDHKIHAIEYFVDKYDIDLSKSYAYGDTRGDYSMLKSVGKPVAFNPSRDFLFELKQDKSMYEKTKIIIERKDVIYKLNLNVEEVNYEGDSENGKL